MSASRLALLAAVVSVAAWGLKAVAIGAAGGLDRSPFEGPLYLLGLVAIIAAFAALGVAVAGQRSVVVRAAGAALGVLVGLGLSMLSSVLATELVPDSAGWVQAEAGLWFSALLALGVTAYWHLGRAGHRSV